MEEKNQKHTRKNKTWMIAVGAAAAAMLLAIGITVWGGQAAPQARGEGLEEMAASDGVVRTRENCTLEQTFLFAPCGHTVSRRVMLPDSLLGADFEQVQSHYHLWQVDVFSPYSIAMSREEKLYCPMHLVLMTDETGRLCIFQNVYGDGLALVEETDCMIEEMKEEAREKLFSGIGFDTREEVEAWIEAHVKS